MPFDHPAHEEGFRVVEDYLVALDLSYRRSRDHPYFMVTFKGEANVHVFVRAWGEDDAVVILRSWIVKGAQLRGPLLQFMLERNHTQRLGMLAVDSDGDILVQHSLGAGTLDQLELEEAIEAVALASARLRTQILERFGGEPF